MLTKQPNYIYGLGEWIRSEQVERLARQRAAGLRVVGATFRFRLDSSARVDLAPAALRFWFVAAPATRPSSLCAWRLDVEPDTAGVAHRPSHEEVILLLRGQLHVTLEGISRNVATGEVIHVPAGSDFKVDGGPDGATAWVTTTAGLTATIGAQTMVPPWAQ